MTTTSLVLVVALVLFARVAALTSVEGGRKIPGVELILSDSCGGDYVDRQGTITSPNYPGNYPNDIDCVWTITTTVPKARIAVTIEYFHLYDDGYDYLEFRDGNSSSAESIERCRYTSCTDFTSTTNSLNIQFYSSHSNVFKGFKLSWLAVDCYSCSNYPSSLQFDPACGEDVYSGHDDWEDLWTSCYTNVYYDGSHHVERGGTENPELDGTCYDSGFSITCYCTPPNCNIDLCQNCSSITPNPSHSTTPAVTTSHSPGTSISPPITIIQPTTTSQAPSPAGPLGCFSCISCNSVDENTQVEILENFLSCFTAIQLGASNLVIRGGSPDLHVDGSCHHEDGAFICYCTTNTCNDDEARLMLENMNSN